MAAAIEMALASGVGMALDLQGGVADHALAFGEDQARYLVATRDPDALIAEAKAAGVHAIVAGEAGGTEFASRELFHIPLTDLRSAHEGWLPAYMAG